MGWCLKSRILPSPEKVQLSAPIGFYDLFSPFLRPSTSKLIAVNENRTPRYVNGNHMPTAAALRLSLGKIRK